ncbi:MAG: tetratricopeptide repeat protein [Bacteroidota bacterium]|nr:tetratricopeptide repeat protein [Bacteroidota bacterium]
MLTAKKKIAVRPAVQQSSVMSTWEKVQEFYAQYNRWILGGLIVVVAIAVAAFIYTSRQRERESEAGIQLRKVQPLVSQQQFKLAIEGDPTRGIPGLRSIVENYGGTTSGTIAALMLGQCYLYTDQYDRALEVFQDASPSDDLMKSNRLAGIAAAYEGKKLYAEAAEYYEDAADMFENDILVATRYFKAARNWCLAGKPEKAKAALEKVDNAKTPRYQQDVVRLRAQYNLENE